MIWFLDASAITKRYVEEPGSPAVRRLFSPRVRRAASALSLVEVPAAVFRRARGGDLAEEAAERIADRVPVDLESGEVVEPRSAVLALAAELVARRPLRGYDAVQLASALRLARETRFALTFVCADRNLCRIARTEGIRALRV
ncbi:MAG: type II toxin-antitoxin system VapC family toxin [Deltaproteobacteria bacterium]|nr:type II toxin-antitoxin system VapC family toxin [Deltaproteobacteria bacterium]